MLVGAVGAGCTGSPCDAMNASYSARAFAPAASRSAICASALARSFAIFSSCLLDGLSPQHAKQVAHRATLLETGHTGEVMSVEYVETPRMRGEPLGIRHLDLCAELFAD